MERVKEFFKKLWEIVKQFFIDLYLSIKYYIFPRYKLLVSYNQTWGDADDKEYIVKKFHKKQEKYLKFITDDDELVEIRGADGLNYRIEQL
tara:strand:- start:362 stop:634 length:273 start_codon:yes stop_codon:yes gene_type:complete